MKEHNRPQNSQLISRLLLIGGLIGALLFVVVMLIEGATRPGYDAWRMAGSALSLGDQGWIQITSFVVSGLLIFGFAFGVRHTLSRGPGMTWGPILLAVAGIGLILAGVFVTDPAFGYPPGTPEGPAHQMTLHGTLHFFPGGLSFFLGLAAACIVFARRFGGDPQWKGWSVFSVVIGILVFAFLVAYAAVAATVPNGGPAGFLERVSIISGLAWVALFALRLLSLMRSSTSSTLPIEEHDSAKQVRTNTN